MKTVKNVLPEFLTKNYLYSYPGLREEYRKTNVEKMQQTVEYFFISLGFKLKKANEFEVKGHRHYNNEKIEFKFSYYEMERSVHKYFSVTRNGRRSNRTIIEKIAQTLNIEAYKIIEKDIDCIVKKDGRINRKIRHDTIIVESSMRNDLGRPYAAVVENKGEVIDWLNEIEIETGNDFKTHTYAISQSLINKRIVVTDYIKNVPIKKYVNIRREDFC